MKTRSSLSSCLSRHLVAACFAGLCAGWALDASAAACPPGWQGEYEWDESAGHPSGGSMFWNYSIEIGENKGRCQARVTGDGHSMEMRVLADVQGDAAAVRLLYREMLPDAGFGSSGEPGEELLRLERRGQQLVTRWGTMTPNVESNAKPGVHFKRTKPAKKKTRGKR